MKEEELDEDEKLARRKKFQQKRIKAQDQPNGERAPKEKYKRKNFDYEDYVHGESDEWYED